MQGWLRVCAVRVLSLGGAGNRIGAEGAATVARALESGRCGLTSLNLDSEWGAGTQRITALCCSVLLFIAMPDICTNIAVLSCVGSVNPNCERIRPRGTTRAVIPVAPVASSTGAAQRALRCQALLLGYGRVRGACVGVRVQGLAGCAGAGAVWPRMRGLTGGSALVP